MIHLLKRAAIGCALTIGLMTAAPALAADCGSPVSYGSTNEKLDKICQTLQGTTGIAASGVASATTTFANATVWQPTFPFIPGRDFFLTLGSTGTGTIMVVYTSDNWATYGPEAGGVDASAPIIVNRITYAGSQIRIRLNVSQANVKVGACPTPATGAPTCTGTVSGTLTGALEQ
jgi:hypothetical protein